VGLGHAVGQAASGHRSCPYRYTQLPVYADEIVDRTSKPTLAALDKSRCSPTRKRWKATKLESQPSP
jgi:hypothetical protein